MPVNDYDLSPAFCRNAVRYNRSEGYPPGIVLIADSEDEFYRVAENATQAVRRSNVKVIFSLPLSRLTKVMNYIAKIVGKNTFPQNFYDESQDDIFVKFRYLDLVIEPFVDNTADTGFAFSHIDGIMFCKKSQYLELKERIFKLEKDDKKRIKLDEDTISIYG